MLNILIAQDTTDGDVGQRYVKEATIKAGMNDMKIPEARRRKLPTPPVQNNVVRFESLCNEGQSGLGTQVQGTLENKKEEFGQEGRNETLSTNVVGSNNTGSYVTEEIVNKLKAVDLNVRTKSRKKSMASALKDKSRNVLNEWNSCQSPNTMYTPENVSSSYSLDSSYEIDGLKSTFDATRSRCGTVRKIEIKKIPGQSLGFFIRKGNGLERKDGVFISRVSLGSVLDEMGLLHAGDEVLEVNDVTTEGFSLEDVALMMQIPDKLILTTCTTAVSHGKSISLKSCKKSNKPHGIKETNLAKIEKSYPSTKNFHQEYNSSKISCDEEINKKYSPVALPPDIVKLRNHDRLVSRRRSHSDGDQVELANALDLLLSKKMNEPDQATSLQTNHNIDKIATTKPIPVSTLTVNQVSHKTARSTGPKSPKFLRKLTLPSSLKKTKSKDCVSEENFTFLKDKKSKKTSIDGWHSHTLDRNSKFKSSKIDFSGKSKKHSVPCDSLGKESNGFGQEAGIKQEFTPIHRKTSSKDSLLTDPSSEPSNIKNDPFTSSNSGLGFTRAQKYIKKAKSSQNLSGSDEALEPETTRKSPRTRRSSVNTPPNIKQPLTKKISVPSLMQPFNTLRRKKSEALMPKFVPRIDINSNDTIESGLLLPGNPHTAFSNDQSGFIEYDGETPDPHFKLTRGFSGMLSVHIINVDNIPRTENALNCYCNIEIDDEFQAITSRKEFTTSAEFDESFEIEMRQACEITIYIFAEMKHGGPEDMIASGKVILEKLLRDCPNHKLKLKMENGVTLYLRLDYTEALKLLKRTPSRLHRGVFGFNLVATLDEEENTIPLIVRKCVEEIELRGLWNLGIYRISGNARKKRLLKAEFDLNSATVDVSADAGIDCNILSGILKDYLRELPEPLISEDMYRSLLDSRIRVQSPDLNTRQGLLSRLITLIPYTNRGTLIYIMDHLVKVADQKERNKMDISNLAVCFGPVLMCSSSVSSSPQGILDFKDQITALEYLLNIWPKLHERGEEVEITII